MSRKISQMKRRVTFRFMVVHTTFNYIFYLYHDGQFSEETGVLGENHRPAASHWQLLSPNVVSNTPRQWVGFDFTTLVVIGTGCICRTL